MKLMPGSPYEKLILLARLEYLWHSPKEIYELLIKEGRLASKTEAMGAIATIRNQIDFLRQVKAIFNENKDLPNAGCSTPPLANPLEDS